MSAFGSDDSLPRMQVCDVPGTLADAYGRPADQITEQPFNLKRAHFHPRGVERVTEGRLEEWRQDLNRWAWDRGFPATLDSRARSLWDVSLGGRLLADVGEIPELLHPRVWCWLATELLPHFIVYRWEWPREVDHQVPAQPNAWRRFGDRPENGLRLALHRFSVYGEEVCLRATEQEFQSLRNRPAYGSDPRVARVVLHCLVEAADDPRSNYGKSGGTRALDANYVCIELRLVNSLRPLCFMTDNAIEHIVAETIERLPELRTEDPL